MVKFPNERRHCYGVGSAVMREKSEVGGEESAIAGSRRVSSSRQQLIDKAWTGPAASGRWKDRGNGDAGDWLCEEGTQPMEGDGQY